MGLQPTLGEFIMAKDSELEEQEEEKSPENLSEEEGEDEDWDEEDLDGEEDPEEGAAEAESASGENVEEESSEEQPEEEPAVPDAVPPAEQPPEVEAKKEEEEKDGEPEEDNSVENGEIKSDSGDSKGDGVEKDAEEQKQDESIPGEALEDIDADWPVHEKALATAKEVAFAASAPRPREGFDVGAIEVTLSFDLGTLRLSLRDLESMREGYVFQLDRPNDEFVTIRANGQPIGRGRIVSVDGRVGVQIEELNGR
ncbi:MAG: FliM/FliN family flagellar motor switch protein [Puniceicoccales bacterium]|nr:FliM/FliN family flagellar motor switch protein [Puniceicoccales bacterium]